jgi:hypothetical protein
MTSSLCVSGLLLLQALQQQSHRLEVAKMPEGCAADAAVRVASDGHPFVDEWLGVQIKTTWQRQTT